LDVRAERFDSEFPDRFREPTKHGLAIGAAHELRLPLRTGSASTGFFIQGQVQLENVDTRLTEQYEVSGRGVLFDQAADFIRRKVALPGYTGNLEFRSRRRDVGIEARSRGGDEVDGNRSIRVLAL